MKPIFSLSAAIVFVLASAFTGAPKKPTATKWTLDKVHSVVRFSVSHMVVSEAEGTFKMFDGSMENSKEDFSDAKIMFTIDANSISTDNENRDKHLKSDDFFNTEKYPQIKFESTSFTPQGNNKYKLVGNLSVRDVTKPVTFDVVYGGTIKTQRGNKCGFKATTTINRIDYNLKYSKTVETGGLAVGHDVTITVKVEMDEAK
jgi:polyisoprenoid-binding protein YceI